MLKSKSLIIPKVMLSRHHRITSKLRRAEVLANIVRLAGIFVIKRARRMIVSGDEGECGVALHRRLILKHTSSAQHYLEFGSTPEETFGEFCPQRDQPGNLHEYPIIQEVVENCEY